MRLPRALLWSLVAGVMLMLVPPMGDEPARAAAKRTVVACSGGNACWPVAFTFTPTGQRMYYAQINGEIRIRNLQTGSNRLWHRVPNVGGAGEQGLLGIALDPRWPKKRWVYVYYTASSPLENRIARIRKVSGTPETQILTRIPAAVIHDGGVIHFGPDGMLYAVTGDAAEPSNSQNTSSPAGKVLRMTKTGRPSRGNPFAGSLTFSYGHRNSFGFAFDPETGDIWQTENGPECADEINHIEKGRNYGWGPSSACPATNTSGPNPAPPERSYTPVIVPTGAAFCSGCKLGPQTEGALLVGSYRNNNILRLILNASRDGISAETSLFTNGRGILAVEAAPDGRIYFSDDHGIYRLVSS